MGFHDRDTVRDIILKSQLLFGGINNCMSRMRVSYHASNVCSRGVAKTTAITGFEQKRILSLFQDDKVSHAIDESRSKSRD